MSSPRPKVINVDLEMEVASKNSITKEKETHVKLNTMNEGDDKLLQIKLMSNYEVALKVVNQHLSQALEQHTKIHELELMGLLGAKVDRKQLEEIHTTVVQVATILRFLSNEMVNNPNFDEVKKNNVNGEVKISATGLFAKLGRTSSQPASLVDEKPENSEDVQLTKSPKI